MQMNHMYFDVKGGGIPLGQQLGKGGSATVYIHGKDTSNAIKVFNQEYLEKEASVVRRLRELQKLSSAADLELEIAGKRFAVGSWPKILVVDRYGAVVGFTMNTVVGGVDLTEIVFARDHRKAFYQYSPGKRKYKSDDHYNLFINTFLYCSEGLRNRFILSYTLAAAFQKIYDLRQKDGQKIDLQLCNFDIKPSNILVGLISHKNSVFIVPYILDLDNLTLSNPTGTLAPQNPQFTPEYSAPEGPKNKYYDFYSVAVIFYQLIFSIHPFEGVQGVSRFSDLTNREDFSKNKCFPWGRNQKFLRHDPLHDNFVRLPNSLQNLFVLAFDSNEPYQRPGLQAWVDGLLDMLSDKSICFEKLFNIPKTDFKQAKPSVTSDSLPSSSRSVLSGLYYSCPPDMKWKIFNFFKDKGWGSPY